MTPTGKISRFLIIDGDKMGDLLAKIYLSNDEDALQQFDHDIRNRMRYASDYLISSGVKMIACGADGITCMTMSSNFIAYRNRISEIVSPYTFSAGIGSSLRDAFISLRYAKASGRNCWAFMDDVGNISLLTTHIKV